MPLPLLVAWLIASLLVSAPLRASVVTPHSDDEVLEVLPAPTGNRGEERRLRRALAAQPRQAALAVPLARRYLAQARELGDPRYAGRALAVLQAWPDDATAPDDVLLLHATVLQYLHDFDTATRQLTTLTQRNPALAQAWLTLATLRRVQGRYGDADAACRGLARTSATLHAAACQAENDSLRGQRTQPASTLQRLAAAPGLDAGVRAWLLTTLAEHHLRAGQPAQAEDAWRMARELDPSDSYTALSLADHLLQQGRPREALTALQGQPRTDPVLLRLAIAGRRAGTAAAANDLREWQDRRAQASLRPDAQSGHAREQAMALLWLDDRPADAVALARENLRHQREPIDLLLLRQAADAAGDAGARTEALDLARHMDLHDERLLARR